jgi:Fur family ferric uptake transcriptional regulator
LQILSEKVKSHRLRLTQQRRVIYEELATVSTHPRAEELYEMVQKKIPHISFGTVYRNLKALKELG